MDRGKLKEERKLQLERERGTEGKLKEGKWEMEIGKGKIVKMN